MPLSLERKKAKGVEGKAEVEEPPKFFEFSVRNGSAESPQVREKSNSTGRIDEKKQEREDGRVEAENGNEKAEENKEGKDGEAKEEEGKEPK